jgi:hypothetical protein
LTPEGGLISSAFEATAGEEYEHKKNFLNLAKGLAITAPALLPGGALAQRHANDGRSGMLKSDAPIPNPLGISIVVAVSNFAQTDSSSWEQLQRDTDSLRRLPAFKSCD